MVNVKIRKATKKDLKEISNILKTESSKKPYNEKFTSKTALKQTTDFLKKQEMYVYEVDSEVAGFVVVHIETDDKKKAFIDELWLKPKYQGKGIGKILVKFVEEEYNKKGINTITLISSKKSKAFGFYKKLNFKEKKDLVFMVKKI